MSDDFRDASSSSPPPSTTAPRIIDKSSQELNICVAYHEGVEAFQDRYVRGDKLGCGGFGNVYRGSRVSDLKPIIIKEIDSSKVPCWCRLDGVLVPMEVVLLTKTCKLAGVVKLLDVFNIDENWYIIMEGNEDTVCDLFDYICERSALGECESAYIVYQLIGILMQCHSTGVLHRDIKDENLLIDRRTKEIRLIDFGSGAFLHEDLYTDFDGTRVYCPPEWIQTASYFGKPAEVWSIGVLLFDMLNGDVPFVNDKGITSGRLRFRKRNLSEEAKHLIYWCMNRRSHARPNLLQILLHPWMKYYRKIVSHDPSTSAGFALSESALFVPSPLTTSVSLRSGLCNLPQEVQVEQRPQHPVSAPQVVATTSSASGKAFRQPAPVTDSQALRHSIDTHRHQEESRLPELARVDSKESHASSGYYTRSNSLCFEEDRKKHAASTQFSFSSPQVHSHGLPGVGAFQQWREKTNTGSSTESSTCNVDYNSTVLVDPFRTSPDFTPLNEFPCCNMQCSQYPTAPDPSLSDASFPVAKDSHLPSNLFDGITITVPPRSQGNKGKRTC